MVLPPLHHERGPGHGVDGSCSCKKTGEKLRKTIRSPYGIFGVTGPTGSGKTTTLYAAKMAVQAALTGHFVLSTLHTKMPWQASTGCMTQEMKRLLEEQLRSELRELIKTAHILQLALKPKSVAPKTSEAAPLLLAESGADEGIRTPDPRITNALLYQLSYISKSLL